MEKQNPTRPYKGLNTGSSPLDQPKGTYTMAWNAINEASDGNNNFISNEQGNQLCGQITVGYKPIGDVYISDGNTVVFSTNGTNSEIGIIDANCNYSVIVNSDCLNFQITNQIDVVFRVRRGCERTIYFTDGLNDVRYFNLDKPDDFKDEGGDFDCDLFKLFLPIQNVCFDGFEILEQGILKFGVYSFALQYLDEDFNPTKWSYITQPIPIFNRPLNGPYIDITGNSNVETDPLGGLEGTSSKAIKLFLTDLDSRYPFYRIAAIESTSFNGNVTRVLVSNERDIRKTSFIYDGNEEAFTLGEINEIRIQPEPIDSAKHIEQLENRLILANVEGRKIDFCSYQQFASQITSQYVVKYAPANALKPQGGVGEGNSKDPNTYWKGRGYMGDEIYAFGIVYVFKDGYESPAYHIPGIAKNFNPCVTDNISIVETISCIELNAFDTLTPGCELTYSITYTYTPDGGSPIETTTGGTITTTPETIELFCASREADTLTIDSFSFNYSPGSPTCDGSDAQVTASIVTKDIVVEIPCDDETPCVPGSFTQYCLRIREQLPDTLLCSGGVTSYTINYTLNGVNSTYNRTINSATDIISGFNEIVCSEYPIKNIEVIVENNNCTAFIEEVPLYEFAFPADVLPGEIGVTWWRMDNKNDGTDAWGIVGPIYAREKATTACVGGLPVPPLGAGWVLLSNDCGTTNTATYVRESPKFIQGPTGILLVEDQSFTTEAIDCCPNCNVPYPNDSTFWNGVQTGDWVEILYGDCAFSGGLGEAKYWLRSQSLYSGNISFTVQNIVRTCPEAPITTWNQDLYYKNPDEAAYNALPEEEKFEYWEIYNTATPIDDTSGYMSYWESPNSTYPTILDCEGNDYWGVDDYGNTLAGTPIRHHKFPDRYLVPQYRNNQLTRRYQSTLVIQIEYTGNETDLDNLYGGAPVSGNPDLPLTIDYDLDGVPQASIDVDIFYNEFVWDGVKFELIDKTIITEFGDGSSGITNVVFSNTIGIDGNTTITNISTINNLEVTPNTDLEVANLGVKFDNIVYPSPDIVGHYIVRGDRDEFNRTVIATGITNGTHESGGGGNNYNLFSYFAGGGTSSGTVTNQSDNYNWLFTAEGLFDRNYPNGTYIKQSGRFIDVSTLQLGNQSTTAEFDNVSEFGAGVGKSAVLGDGYAVISNVRKINYAGIAPDLKIREIFKSIVLNGLTFDDTFVPNRRLYNISHTNIAQFLELQFPGMNGNGTRNLPYVQVKADRDIHPDLFSIQYYRTHNCVIKNNEENLIFGGDIFVGPLELGNTIFFEFQDTVWDTVLLIAGIVIALVLTIVLAPAGAAALGALIPALSAAVAAGTVASAIIVTAIVAASIGIAAAQINQIILSMRESGLQSVTKEDGEIGNLSFSTKQYMEYANEFIAGIYVESTINLGYRQDHFLYFPGAFYKGERDVREYFRDKLVVFDNDATEKKDYWVHRGIVVPEVYHYNPDYSKFNKDNVYVPLPENYDCCSPCLEVHPTRVHYSQQSFQEEGADNFRVFLPNNYRDIEAEKGEITNVFRRNNNLLIHTQDALWNLPQNIQERITGDLISFIGTGEYFSIPPRLVSDDDLGSAGSLHKWATIKTDIGVFFIDEKNRDIYLYTASQGLKPISNVGMRNFFKNNLISFLATQFKQITGETFLNSNNPANPNGTGYHVVYDTRHERLILTKRDYLVLSEYSAFEIVTSVAGVITGINLDDFFYDETTQQFGIGTGVDTYVFVELGDPLYFENKSFTISYSLLSQTWISFHSYIPLYYFYIHNQFYSFLDNAIWKHNIIGLYQNFYGTRYPHIIEYISLSSPTMTRLWDEVLLQTIARVYSATSKQFTDEESITFNKAIFYNSKQASGLLNLIVKDNSDENYLINQVLNIAGDQIIIDRNERNWTLNEIRDYRTNYGESIWTKEWDSIKNEFPIDKVLNASTIDFAKIWTDLQVMRDKYLVIRLIFDTFDNVNLITNYSFEKENPSFR
jgi:hypothetical protein